MAATSGARSSQPVKSCPVCGGRPTWRMLDAVSCTPDLGTVLERIYAADPDPFIPPVPRPIGRVTR